MVIETGCDGLVRSTCPGWPPACSLAVCSAAANPEGLARHRSRTSASRKQHNILAHPRARKRAHTRPYLSTYGRKEKANIPITLRPKVTKSHLSWVACYSPVAQQSRGTIARRPTYSVSTLSSRCHPISPSVISHETTPSGSPQLTTVRSAHFTLLPLTSLSPSRSASPTPVPVRVASAPRVPLRPPAPPKHVCFPGTVRSVSRHPRVCRGVA